QNSYQSAFRHAATAGFSEMHSFGYDVQSRALMVYARTLWGAGLPDQAAQLAHPGIQVAGRQNHPVSLCMSLTFGVSIFLWRGDLQIVEDLIERLTALAARYSLAIYQASDLGLRGQLLLARGETQSGVEILREALSTMRNARRYILSSVFSR